LGLLLAQDIIGRVVYNKPEPGPVIKNLCIYLWSSLGATQYQWLSECLGLPGPRVVRRWAGGMKLSHGFQEDTLESLKPTVATEDYILTLDDIAVIPSRLPLGNIVPGDSAPTDFDASWSGTGVSDYAGNTSTLATQVLTCGLHGVKTKKMQPIYFLPHKPAGEDTRRWLKLLEIVICGLRDRGIAPAVVVGDMGGGYKGVVLALTDEKKFRSTFRIQYPPSLGSKYAMYSMPIISGVPLIFNFDAPHWARNTLNRWRITPLRLYFNGPSILISHLTLVLMKGFGDSVLFSYRCVAGSGEAQHTDAAGLVFNVSNVSNVFNIVGPRAGATALFLWSMATMYHAFVGEGCDNLASCFAAIIFFRSWRKGCDGKLADYFITHDAYCGLEMGLSCLLAWALLNKPIANAACFNTLRMENHFSYTRGGQGNVSLGSASLTVSEFLLNSRKGSFKSNVAQTAEMLFGIPPPSKKARRTLAASNNLQYEPVTNNKHNNYNSNNNNNNKNAIPTSSPAIIGNRDDYVSDSWRKGVSIIKELLQVYLPKDKKIATLVDSIVATAEGKDSLWHEGLQTTWAELIRCVHPEDIPPGQTDLESDDSADDSNHDSDSNDESDQGDKVQNEWSFINCAEVQVEFDSDHPNNVRKRLKLPARMKTDGTREKRFRAPKSFIPQAARCTCIFQYLSTIPILVSDSENRCPCRRSTLLPFWEEMQRRHLQIGSNVEFIGGGMAGHVGVVEEIHMSCIGKGKNGKKKVAITILPCCLLDLGDVSMIVFVEEKMASITIAAHSTNLRSIDEVVAPAEKNLRNSWKCKCAATNNITGTNQQLHEIERLVAYKFEKETAWWFVKWRNFSEKLNSWEPEMELQKFVSDAGWKELIDMFRTTDNMDNTKRRRKPKLDPDMVRWG